MAMNIAVSNATPGYAPIGELCRQPPPSRRPACIAVLAQMASSGELIDQVIGLHLGAPLVADSAEGVAWRERLRWLSWLRHSKTGCPMRRA